ncbi:hypothetical protein BC936DRAFT_147384 [Jimgerdemannia flammicorona]|uniref:Uncharacterized protein n=1 Tax=Jimgerdemannia flammicorona TaxID=994334 RepID=A0A433D5E9_9FUNG|nr:hypothetical protein BC936DRAFT_147384 [Jimgerdemannia flammicorona]
MFGHISTLLYFRLARTTSTVRFTPSTWSRGVHTGGHNIGGAGGCDTFHSRVLITSGKVPEDRGASGWI